mgnify:CR=1 FL=1
MCVEQKGSPFCAIKRWFTVLCKTRHTMTLVLLFHVLVTNASPNAWGQENVTVSNTDAETKNWSVNIDGIGGWDHFTFRPACCTDEQLFFELRLPPNDPTLHKSFLFDHHRIFPHSLCLIRNVETLFHLKNVGDFTVEFRKDKLLSNTRACQETGQRAIFNVWNNSVTIITHLKQDIVLNINKTTDVPFVWVDGVKGSSVTVNLNGDDSTEQSGLLYVFSSTTNTKQL